MPRPPGGLLTVGASKVVSVRVPQGLHAQAMEQCGGVKRKLAEFVRNALRVACGVPLNFEAGYDEGFRQGWADAKEAFEGGSRRSSGGGG